MVKKSLKDQLKEAGFRTGKMENEREAVQGRVRKESEKHQVARNFCEHCSLIHPDVELYKHSMPTTDAEWMCLSCADKLMIDDKFRKTRQSDDSKKKMFRRYFGATKDFDREARESKGPRANNKNRPKPDPRGGNR